MLSLLLFVLIWDFWTNKWFCLALETNSQLSWSPTVWIWHNNSWPGDVQVMKTLFFHIIKQDVLGLCLLSKTRISPKKFKTLNSFRLYVPLIGMHGFLSCPCLLIYVSLTRKCSVFYSQHVMPLGKISLNLIKFYIYYPTYFR